MRLMSGGGSARREGTSVIRELADAVGAREKGGRYGAERHLLGQKDGFPRSNFVPVSVSRGIAGSWKYAPRIDKASAIEGSEKLVSHWAIANKKGALG